ncbi:MAG TPA: VOC family protein, partial [Actinomycetota bacterium]|nr:VOC family protein [Actinomycetota bacterium]
MSENLFTGGNATIYVTDLDRSVRFYTETLGLGLAFRAGDSWAQIDGGRGLSLGLHVAPPGAPQPGTIGSITVGFQVARPIDDVARELELRGVAVRRPPSEGAAKLAFFT